MTALIEEPQEDMQLDIRVKHVGKILKNGCELRMTSQIGDYDMDYIILDLGSHVNTLTRQTWESMGKPRLEWSPNKLKLSMQPTL